MEKQLTEKQIDFLYNEITKEPKAENLAFIQYFCSMNRAFVSYVINECIVPCMKEDGEEITKDSVAAEFTDIVLDWACDLNRMWGFVDCFMEKGNIRVCGIAS